jgi:hypothetical protein
VLCGGVLRQGAASIVGHTGIGMASRQQLIGMAGMLQFVYMPNEHAVCMPMIAKLLLVVERVIRGAAKVHA